MRTILFIFSALLISYSFGFEDDDLRSNTWEFKNTKEEKWLPAKFLDVHLDLIENGVIEHPYYANNEKIVQWVENENWEYRTTLLAKDSLLNQRHIELVFLGLDTYCEVYLNDSLILFAENMFREWRVDIKEFLKKGENELRLVFLSPIEYNKEKVLNAAYELPAANEGEDIPIKVSPYTRKAAYQFGWDWGPRILSFSAWRPIRLETWNELCVMDASVYTSYIDSLKARMFLSLELSVDSSQYYFVQFMGHKFRPKVNPNGPRLTFGIDINEPKLWYPRGYGDPHNYKEQLLLINSNGDTIIDRELKFGIRTVKLINEKDEIGTSFYFKINDQPVFAKGANYIPQSLFLNEVEESDYESLIQDAVDLNMNMLRIWGGGIYEREKFYELCDENGIMVWQDYMFANSLYPSNEEFLENVEMEIRENVKRISAHPSVIVFCGNNEIEVALDNWGWQTKYGWSAEEEQKIRSDYDYMFKELFQLVQFRWTSNVAYVSTSPLCNWGKPENFNHSSMHYWGVWHGGDPLEAYKENVGRFMAEYGFQSFPSYEYLLKYIPEEEMYLDSETIKNRQKSYVGNGLIDENIKKFIKGDLDFKEWTKYSQLVQAHALQLAISSHRIGAPHCMGTLFWQFNDCWPGPSWSIRSYSGELKEGAKVVKKYYSPVVATIESTEDGYHVKINSDRLDTVEVELRVIVYNTEGDTLYKTDGTHMVKPYSLLRVISHFPKKACKKIFPKKKHYFKIEIRENEELFFEDNYFPNAQTSIRELSDFK